MTNKVVFASNINIGQNGAENDDDFLFKCFIDHPALAELRDLSSPVMFALGSTGIGKTAMLKMLEHQEENCSALEVHDMAMNHIANSDTIGFMKSIEVDLSLFFQALWKHVLCIEYIKLIVRERDRDKFKFLLGRIVSGRGRDRVREKLEKFVEDNQDRFWNTIDENVIELTNALESNVNAELGGEVDKFVAKAGYARGLSAEKKVQLQQRAKKFVNQSVVTELASVIGGLGDYTRGREDRYFVTIDGLDENWVDGSLKYQLIQALFEALKPLRKLRNFKVVVSLRNDIFEKMIREMPSSQGQLEKFNDLIVRVKWSREQLRSLTDKRLNYLFRWKYSSSDVFFNDVFGQKIDNRISTWQYLIERTMLRPRDVINFVNAALQASEGKSTVSKTNFMKGEGAYSQLRLDTLKFEWGVTFPGISAHLDMLIGRPPYFTASELMTSKLVEDLYYSLGQTEALRRDPIWERIERSGGVDPHELGAEVFQRLHLVGAVGIKVDKETPWDWIYESGRPLQVHQISSATRVKIHPMLYAALKTVPERQTNSAA